MVGVLGLRVTWVTQFSSSVLCEIDEFGECLLQFHEGQVIGSLNIFQIYVFFPLHMTTNKNSCWNGLKPRVSGWLHHVTSLCVGNQFAKHLVPQKPPPVSIKWGASFHQAVFVHSEWHPATSKARAHISTCLQLHQASRAHGSQTFQTAGRPLRFIGFGYGSTLGYQQTYIFLVILSQTPFVWVLPLFGKRRVCQFVQNWAMNHR